jgi:hypothetical protein
MVLLSKICPRCKKVARGDREGFTCITCGWNEYIIPDPPKEIIGSIPLADKFFLAYKGTNPKYKRVRAAIITFLYLTPKKLDRILYFMECPIGSCGIRTAGRKSWESSIRKLDEDFYLFLCTEKHLWYLVILNGEPLYWLTQNLEVSYATQNKIKSKSKGKKK